MILIRQRTKIGTLPDGNDVFAINKVTVLPLCLDEPKDLELEVSTLLARVGFLPGRNLLLLYRWKKLDETGRNLEVFHPVVSKTLTIIKLIGRNCFLVERMFCGKNIFPWKK